MKIYDVSMIISKEMQVYKNLEEKKPLLEVVSDFSNGSSHETQITMNLHTGTHMDFPLHMLEDGLSSDSLDLSKLIRSVKIFDLSHVQNSIKTEDLLGLDIKADDFILFKTRNSEEEVFNHKFIFVSEQASIYLSNLNICGIGVDGLGIERDQIGHPTHKNLMNKEIIIIEGLRLKNVKQGRYFMYALPIKIKNVDALPLSIILI
ncbi:MAG: cyclase family protein, partial [Bacillota bacterium]